MASKAVREAKARLAEVNARIAAHDAAAKAKEDAKAPARAARDAWRKKGARQPVLFGPKDVALLAHGFAAIENSYGNGVAGKTVREVKKGLADKEIKVVALGGNGMTAWGLAQRLRVPDKATIAQLGKAKRAVQRASAALSRATQNEMNALREAYVAGAKVSVDELIERVAKGLIVLANAPDDRYAATYSMEAYNRQRLVDYDLVDAQKHLEATKSGAECPCHVCAQARSEAAAKKALADKLAALPKVIRTCPEHGRKRMPTGRGPARFGDRYVEDGPILYCPVGNHRLLDAAQYAKEVAKRERAEARAKARAPRLNWVCPDPECGNLNAFLPVLDPATQEDWVTCENPACEGEFRAETVKTVKPERKAAAA